MFDFSKAQGKDKKGELIFNWHCKSKDFLDYKNDGIKGYAIFKNVKEMEEIGQCDGKSGEQRRPNP